MSVVDLNYTKLFNIHCMKFCKVYKNKTLVQIICKSSTLVTKLLQAVITLVTCRIVMLSFCKFFLVHHPKNTLFLELMKNNCYYLMTFYDKQYKIFKIYLEIYSYSKFYLTYFLLLSPLPRTKLLIILICT